jgi:flagellum-specific ATP synthase
MVSLYLENRDLMLMGGYTPGQDAELDEAIRLWPAIQDLIRQGAHDPATLEDSARQLSALEPSGSKGTE